VDLGLWIWDCGFGIVDLGMWIWEFGFFKQPITHNLQPTTWVMSLDHCLKRVIRYFVQTSARNFEYND